MAVNNLCVVIGKPIVTPSCPLPVGECVWKHRKTGICTYDPKIASDISVADLCERTGLPLPTEAQILETKTALLTEIKAELKGN